MATKVRLKKRWHLVMAGEEVTLEDAEAKRIVDLGGAEYAAAVVTSTPVNAAILPAIVQQQGHQDKRRK